MTRRQLILTAIGLIPVSNCILAQGTTMPLHCTPAPKFPVPLTKGFWRSQEFPVGNHDYHVWLEVDRRMPLEELDCDLGPNAGSSPGYQCITTPLLDLEWTIWDKTAQVKNWPAKPIEADAWSAAETRCFLGNFQGKKNSYCTLELNVKKDAGRLKDLHPRIQIAKNPGYEERVKGLRPPAYCSPYWSDSGG